MSHVTSRATCRGTRTRGVGKVSDDEPAQGEVVDDEPARGKVVDDEPRDELWRRATRCAEAPEHAA
jgi:hypothetical protein